MLIPKSIRRSLQTIVLLFFALGLILLGLFLKPSLVVNPGTVNYLQKEYLSEWVSWENIEINFGKTSFWERTLEIKIENLNASYEQNQLLSPLVKMRVAVDLDPSDFKIQEVGPLKMTALEGTIDLSQPSEEQDESAPSGFNLELFKKYQDILVKGINIEIKALELVQAESRDIYNGQISFSGFNVNKREELRVTINSQEQLQFSQALLSLQFENYRPLLNPETTLYLTAEVKKDQKKWVDVNLTVQPESLEKQKLNAKAVLLHEQANVLVKIDGLRDLNEFTANFGVQVTNIAGKTAGMDLKDCQTTIRWGSSFEEELDLKLGCDGRGNHSEKTNNDLIDSFLPQRIDFTLNSHSKLVGPADNKRLWTDSDLEIEKISNGPLEISGKLNLDGESSVNEFAIQEFDALFDFKLDIPEFYGLVEKLRNTDYPVPAPFNQLKGPAGCQFSGDYAASHKSDEFPLSCSMKLKGAEQKIDVETRGFLRVVKQKEKIKPHLEMDVLIDGIDLTLPSVKVGESFPPITPDERFITKQPPPEPKPFPREEKPVKAPDAFSYVLQVKTLKADSIRLYSNVTENPLPVLIDIRLENGKQPSGEVAVRNFEFNILRREGDISYFTMNLKDQEINGLIKFKNNDYKISLKVFGTVSQPDYIFESDPPLSQSEILAVLLFGAKPELLEENKQRSVDETRAAIADGAINLISMYYLASTPVESVGYNPESGIFSARISLAEGLSLSVGSDSEDTNEVGLRKRLGSGWVIDTSVRNGSDGESNKGIAMLKWGKRY